MALSPDDRRVAASGWGPIAVWDFETGERLGAEHVGHLQEFGTLAVSPDGQHVLTAGEEGLAIVWETGSGRPAHVWRNPRDQATPVYGSGFSAAAFSADGKRIATSAHNELLLRDRESGEVVHQWPANRGPHGQTTLGFTPDSGRLLSFGDDWFLRVLEIGTGNEVHKHAIRPTGVPLKEGPDGTVEPEILQFGSLGGLAPSPLLAAMFTPDGRTLVVVTRKTVHLFDVQTGQEQSHYEAGRKSRRLLRTVTGDDDLEWADDQAAQLNQYVAVAPDSRWLATVGLRAATERSREYELQIRGLQDGAVAASFPLNGESEELYSPPLAALAFSPEGAKIAVSSRLAHAQGPIDVYDVATGRLEARIERPGFRLAYTPDGLAFTPDGKWIVASQTDTTALVWDWKRFLVAVDLHGDPLPEGAIARLGTVRYRAGGGGYRVGRGEGRIEFLPDGRTLLGCSGGRVLWLDVTTGRLVRSLNMGADRLALLLAVTRDRSTAAVRTSRFPKGRPAGKGAEYQVVLIDTSTGEERARLPVWKTGSYEQPEPATCAAFTPDGNRLAMGDAAGGLWLWNLVTRQEEQAATMPSAGKVPRGSVWPSPDTVQRVSFSADGKWLVAASRQEAVRWNWQDDEPVQPIGQAQRIRTLEIAPDGETVVVLGGRTIELFDVATGRRRRDLAAKGELPAMLQSAFTSDGSRLVVPMSSARRLDVWNVRNGELERSWPFESMGLRRWAVKATVSPDDRWLAAVGVGDVAIAVWNLKTGERIGDEQVGHLQRINRLTVSPDGAQVLTAGYDGLAIVWNAESGRPVHMFRPSQNPTLHQGLAFSPDGKWIATSTSGQVVLRNRESAESVHTWPGHGGDRNPRLLRFTPDSKRLLSFGEDWFLRAFDVRTGEMLLEHAIQAAREAEFSQDGRILVLVSPLRNNDQVQLFNVETGREQTRYELKGHVASLAVSPDGQHLATVQIDTVLRASSEFPSLQYRRLQNGALAFSFPLVSEGDLIPVAFSPDGSKIAVASPAIEVYDLATARRIARIEAAPRDVSALVFTPDGERLVASHADAAAVIWEWRRFPVAGEDRRR